MVIETADRPFSISYGWLHGTFEAKIVSKIAALATRSLVHLLASCDRIVSTTK